MKKAIALSVLCLATCLPAEKKNAIQRFGENDLQTIKTKVRFTTVILLPDGEEIAEVTCGDKEYWVIEGRDGFVYVKPAKEGALTNVNIITKSKTVYSILVQEISKPGGSTKEKPDLKVVLGADELTKLKKDKENLEELLLRSERTGKVPETSPEPEQAKKKDDAPLPPPEAQVSAPKTEPASEVKASDAAITLARPEVAKALAVQEAKPVEVVFPSAQATPAEKPLVRVVTIERSEGILRKFGRLLRRVGVKLRLY